MMLSKGLNKKVVLGVVCGLSLPVAVNASDFIYAKTVTAPGEYNFHEGIVSTGDELISFNNSNTSGSPKNYIINIENAGELKLDSTSPWGVIDVGSNNQKANYAEAAITINGDLEISNKIQNNNDGRIISLMGGKNTLHINGSLKISDSVCSYGSANLWHYGLKANNGSEIIVRNDFIINSLQAESISDSAWQTFAAGIYSDSWSCNGNDSDERSKDADVLITVGTDNNDKIILENIKSTSKSGVAFTYGVLATYGDTGNNKREQTATINLNGSTVIRNLDAIGKSEADVYALAAEGNGVINVNGDLLIENIGDSSSLTADVERYYNAVVAAGGSVNINVAGNAENKIRITGDLASYMENSAINLHLLNRDSYLRGASLTDGGSINLTLADGAVWQVLDRVECGDSAVDALKNSSEVSNLTLKNGIVDLYHNDWSFQELKIDRLHGDSGTFIINTDLNKGESDRLTISNASGAGNYKLLTYDPEASALSGKQFEQKIIDAPVGNFNLTSSIMEGALYNYQAQLTKITVGGRNEWKIVGLGTGDVEDKANNTSTTVKSACSAGSHIYYGWRNNTIVRQRLTKMHRVPEVRSGMGIMKNAERLLHEQIDNGGIWVQLQRGEDAYRGRNYFESQYNTYAIGFDRQVTNDSKGNWLLGAAVLYTEGKGNYASGTGDYQDLGLNLYGVRRLLSGHYLDLNLKVNHMENDVASRTLTGDHVGSKLRNNGISLDAVYGKRILLDEYGWYLDPQLEITLGRLNGAGYSTDNGVRVQTDGVNSASCGIGIALGRAFANGGNIYVRGSWLHEFGGSYDINMTDSNNVQLVESQSMKDTWYEVDLGGDVMLGKQNNLYFGIARSFGGTFQKKWQVNAGLRFSF